MPALPSYLPRPDRQFFDLPYRIDKAQMLGLLLEVPDASVLQSRFIDPTLNEASGGEPRFVSSFGGHFVLGHVYYPSVTHSSPEFGGFRYSESVVYLPIRDTQAPFGQPSNYWFTPSIVLDSFMPLIAGREIYGFPKVLGQLDTAPGPLEDLFSAVHPAATGQVQAQGFASTDKSEIAALQPVWSWQVGGEAGSLLENLAGHAANDIFSLHLPKPLQWLEFPWDEILRFIGRFDPGLFLKEIPSVTSVSDAAYRKLVRADYSPTAVHRIRLLSGNATFHNPASYPIADTLGFPSGDAIPSKLAFIVEMDWAVPAGDELPGQ